LQADGSIAEGELEAGAPVSWLRLDVA